MVNHVKIVSSVNLEIDLTFPQTHMDVFYAEALRIGISLVSHGKIRRSMIGEARNGIVRYCWALPYVVPHYRGLKRQQYLF